MNALEIHIAAVEALYKPLVTGQSSRITGVAKLWAQFEGVAKASRVENPVTVAALIERVNELAVAQLILDDPALEGELHYEPDILADGKRIDFVVRGRTENTYIEVKTVNPRADDSDASWQKHLDRREHQRDTVHYIVDKGWLGAELYGNSFSARAHFFDYARQFEARLAPAPACWYFVAPVSHGTYPSWGTSPTSI